MTLRFLTGCLWVIVAAGTALSGQITSIPGASGGGGGTSVSFAGLHLKVDTTYYYANRRMTPIVTGDWSSVNFLAGTSRTNNTGNISLQTSASSSGQFSFVCTTLPAAPYTVRLHLVLPDTELTSPPYVMALRESSTGKFVAFGPTGNNNQFMIQKYTDPSTVSGAAISQISSMHWMKAVWSMTFVDDSTYRYYWFWDGQGNYVPTYVNNSGFYTRVLNNDFIVANQICAGWKVTNANYQANLQLVGYDVNPSW